MEGNVRYGDRERFNVAVRKIVQKELNDMGFRITSLVLTYISDDDGYSENLSRPQIAKIDKKLK